MLDVWDRKQSVMQEGEEQTSCGSVVELQSGADYAFEI